MKRALLFFPMLMIGISYFGQEAPAAETSAAEIYAKSLEALGGKAALENLSTVRLNGKGEAFRLAGDFTIQARFPDQFRLDAITDYYQFVRAYNGKIGWERQAWEGSTPPTKPHLRQLGSHGLARLKTNAPFLPFLAVLDEIPEIEDRLDWNEHTVHVLRFSPEGRPPETYYIDVDSFLPLMRRYTSVYAEGENVVETIYADYRPEGSLNLPHSIEFPGPDLPRVHFEITEINYELNAQLSDSVFVYPHADRMNEPYKFSLRTVPFGVYKELDPDLLGGIGAWWNQNPRWGGTFGPTESWVFDLLVDETYGRWLQPTAATVSFYEGSTKVRTVEFSEESLKMIRRSNVSRFSGMSSVHVLRHHFTAPVDLKIDRMSYRLVLEGPSGDVIAEQDIPVSYYEQKTKLIFPIKGPFIELSGHAYNDINHKDEWTQWFAYDIYPLSPDVLAIFTDTDVPNEKFYGFRRVEVMSPADGVVVYARNDIPEGEPEELRATGIKDPIQAIGGNMVLIDHGNNEVSFFGHLSQGSVRVKKGDQVKQGQVIGLLGSSMSPNVPHLHYHLQASPVFPRGDGLPSKFENVESLVPIPGYPVATPRRGYYLKAVEWKQKKAN